MNYNMKPLTLAAFAVAVLLALLIAWWISILGLFAYGVTAIILYNFKGSDSKQKITWARLFLILLTLSFVFFIWQVEDNKHDAIAVLIGMTIFVSLVVVVVELFRRRWKSAGIWGGVAVIAIIISSISANEAAMQPNPYTPSSMADVDYYRNCLKSGGLSKAQCMTLAKGFGQTPRPEDKSLTPAPAPTAAKEAAEATDSPEPTETPAPPTPQPTTYEQYMKEQKAEFLSGVDELISGAQIAGNPYKYVGDDVDLHCTVSDIPDPLWFNASCGTDDDGLPAIIVIQYDDTSSLDKGQSIRVMGTVVDPMQGTNAYGGDRTFPTVQAQFME